MLSIAPSILTADFLRLGEQVTEALEAGADWIHVDVMDGHFVPNLTVGPLVVAALKPLVVQHEATIDVHLMLEQPEQFLKTFARAGADRVTVHVEACTHLHRVVQEIGDAGMKAGVALNPSTPLIAAEEIIPYIDLLLIMAVNPGFPSQGFIGGITDKIGRARQVLNEFGSKALLQVDGGIGPRTIRRVVNAGADVVVAGSSVFDNVAGSTVRERIDKLRQAASVHA